MPFRSVPTGIFRKWLRSRELVYVRTKGGHEIWDYPDGSLLRPVIFRAEPKDIPPLQIQTNLNTLGVSKKEFYEEIAKM